VEGELMITRLKIQNNLKNAFNIKLQRKTYSKEADGSSESKNEEGLVHFYSLDDEVLGKLLKPLIPVGDKDPAKTFRYGASLISQLQNYKSLIPESIIGWTNSTTPESVHLDFREQSAFLKFLHNTIATYVDNYERCQYLRTKAKLFKSGWMHIEDERALIPLGRTPDPDDIIGYCLVRDGKIIPGSYQAMPTHRLFSHLGEFRLPDPIYRFVLSKLIERLERANTKKN
jgi:hypothetical protein